MVNIRKAISKDIDKIIDVEQRAWPPGGAATKEMMKSRINVFPDGVWVAESDGVVIGVVCFEIINYTGPSSIKNWYLTTDNGFITRSHSLSGNAIFGIDLSVIPEAPRGVGTKLLQQVGREAVRRNLKCGLLGGRIPGYHLYAKRYSPEEYINLKNEVGEYVDSEMRFYHHASLKIGGIIKEYFSDPESLNYGVLLEWKNPFYVKNKYMGKILGKILSKAFRL